MVCQGQIVKTRSGVCLWNHEKKRLEAKGREMSKISRKMKRWRRKQKRGAIMQPATFEAIKRKAQEMGYIKPEAVAGKAYWKTARAKFRKRKNK